MDYEYELDESDICDIERDAALYFDHRLHCLKLTITTPITRGKLDIEDWMKEQDWRVLTTEQLASDWDTETTS